ncbi:MAG: S8 family serine peptidase, partial [Sandaracinobacteroides sp.]
VIIAGAADAQGRISSFSNRAGSARSNYVLELGEDVRSFDHTGRALVYSGTSFSAPAVSGAKAHLAQAFPNLSASALVEIILTTAGDVGDPGTDSVTGRGRLDIARAIAPIGQTSLSGTAVPISATAAGALGSAMGDGLSGGTGLRTVPVTDSYERAYAFALASGLRPASAARLTGRLGGASLLSAGTQARHGTLALRLDLRATSLQDRMAADPFRDEDRQVAHLGLALRGVDYRAAARNPLRETRFSLRSGTAGLTLATGRLAEAALPGSAAPGLVADDGLAPDEGTGSTGRQLLMADLSRGRFTVALAAGSSEAAPSAIPGLAADARQYRLTLAASTAAGPLQIAGHASQIVDEGALLGTRL